jgi:hypothetical protein
VIAAGAYCLSTHCLGDLGALFKKEAATKDQDDELPARDDTGKVHGELPKAEDLDKCSAGALEQLLDELEDSVEQRISVTSQLGAEPKHGQRQGREQELI